MITAVDDKEQTYRLFIDSHYFTYAFACMVETFVQDSIKILISVVWLNQFYIVWSRNDRQSDLISSKERVINKNILSIMYDCI